MNSSIMKKSMYFFLLPAFILYLVFLIFPIGKVFQYSVSDYNGVARSFSYIGLENYKTVFADWSMFEYIKNTIVYAVIYVVLSNIIALCLALVLNMEIKGRGLYRSVFYIPALFSTIVVGFVWSYVYMPDYGLIGSLFKSIGIQAGANINLLGNYKTALYAIIAVEIWKNFGQSSIIFLAGLQTVPNELIEAAKIDGCSEWKLIRYVKIPLLAASMTINITLGVIGSLKAFDYPYIMTNGGPGTSTNTLLISVFRYAFVNQNYGVGSALGVIAFIVIGIISAILAINLRKREVSI